MNIATIIIFAFLLISITLGILAQRGKDMSLEQWSVGGRGFGTIFIFLLMAGEIYTTFTFLGGSGWAYGKGGPAFYIIGYGTLAYIISYWLLPAIWRYAKKEKLLSQSDFFVAKYKSKTLGVIVSVVAVVALVPYLITQLAGLGKIVSITSDGLISSSLAIWISVISVTVYVMISGIHGSAWTAVLKDIMILGIVLFLGIYLPYHYFGGFQPMFEAINTQNAAHLLLPETGQSASWFASTVLMTAIGFYMWPHTFASAFSAKDVRTFRKNAIIMPLYQLILLFVFFVGFAAILVVPDLADPDSSLIVLSMKTFDPWVVGLIGAAGLLTAIVPGSMILMAAATLIAKNIYKVAVPDAPDAKVALIAKCLVPAVAAVALYFTLYNSSSIVTLLLMGYSLVTQLLPALLCSLMKKNFVTKYGAMAGIIAGVATVTYMTTQSQTIGTLFTFLPQAIKDLNVGIVALVVNIVVMCLVSLVKVKEVNTAK